MVFLSSVLCPILNLIFAFLSFTATPLLEDSLTDSFLNDCTFTWF